MTDNPQTRRSCVYIGGSGRNGSTLLGLCLAKQADVFFAGELTHIWRRGFLDNQLCGCGSPFRQCDFWQAVSKKAFGITEKREIERIARIRDDISSFRRIAGLLIGKSSHATLGRQYADIYDQLIQAIAAVSGSACIIDSSKYPTDLEVLLRHSKTPIEVIHLVRDCNAVVHSWKKRKRRTEIHWKAQDMPRYGALKTAVAWRLFHQLIPQLAERHGANCRLVAYESFVAELPASLLQIAEAFGISVRECGFEQVNPHSVSGNPCRFAFDFDQIALDQQWKRNGSNFDRAIVQLVCGRLQRRLGYGADGQVSNHECQ